MEPKVASSGQTTGVQVHVVDVLRQVYQRP
jgi:hypothetical protein